MQKFEIVNKNELFKTKEPAFCAKVKGAKDGDKFFINFCHSDSVQPPPLFLAEAELKKLIEEENLTELARYTIPLVLEGLETTKDKKGNDSKLSHAVINSTFYNGVVAHSDIYKRFLAYVTIETINAKFDLKLDKFDYVILNNKKFQLPVGKDKFSPFLNACITHSVLDQNQNELEDDGDDEQLKNVEESNTNNRVHIFLYIKQQKVTIYVKFCDKIDCDQLELMMNADRICIRDGEQVLEDFRISVKIQVETAVAEFKNNCLKITSDVLL